MELSRRTFRQLRARLLRGRGRQVCEPAPRPLGEELQLRAVVEEREAERPADETEGADR